jgi:DNA-binding transcriptional LysR family regulator
VRNVITQPTLSQQIRQLEKIIGTPLLQRRREGLRLTKAGSVLLEESRAVLSLVDHGMSRTRQAAGLARPRLRFIVPPDLPEDLAVAAASRLRRTATAAGIDVAWLERPLDAGFSLIRQRRADAGLGWLTAGPEALPASLDAMSLPGHRTGPARHGSCRSGGRCWLGFGSGARAPDPGAIADAALGPLYRRALWGTLPADPAYASSLVDRLLSLACHNGANT